MWFGESEANVRNLFDKARAAAPSIHNYDANDSISRDRSSGGAGGGEASDRVMNQILAEIDVASQKNVFVIGATNRPDILDPAVTRPGRLDRLVHIPLPDLESRKSILKANTRKSPLDPDVDFEAIGDATEGFSGADLTEICQTAAKTAIRQSVLAKIAHNARVDSGELPEDAEWVDPVPRITALHFRDAMSGARRSVPQAEIDRFNAFEKAMKVNTATGGKKFSFDGDKKEGGEE
jgi:transitional endoplasmic reticulum ATPase